VPASVNKIKIIKKEKLVASPLSPSWARQAHLSCRRRWRARGGRARGEQADAGGAGGGRDGGGGSEGREREIEVRVWLGYMGFIRLGPLTEAGFIRKPFLKIGVLTEAVIVKVTVSVNRFCEAVF